MKTFRHLFLIAFFLGLTALEIAHGVFRLNTVRDNQDRETIAATERAHNELARKVRTRLEEERQHAGYLLRFPAIRRFLKSSADEAAARLLGAELLAYLISFRGIDRVRVLDAEGLEQFRCERQGQGAGVLSRDLLRREPDASILALTKDARPGEVVLSELAVDSIRVEVPENDRQVLNFAAAIHDEEGKRLGTLVLTVYAAQILNEIRRSTPVTGVFSVLVSNDGSYLACAVRSKEKGSPEAGNLRDDYPEAAPRLLSGDKRVATVNALFLATPTGELESIEKKSPWFLVTCIPSAALESASSNLRGEYAWVIGSMLLTTILLVCAGAFLVRMSIQEFQFREAARFEKQQKEMERQMQLSERLGSLGLLTAGVAHEINNPLEGIENYLSLLEREGAPAEKRRKYVEMVRYGFHRIRDIVRDLSAFARPGVTESTADVGKVARQALKMVGYTKEFKTVDVQLHGLDDPLVIQGDPGRLEQVFINLLLNAATAMKGQGMLSIQARTVAPGADGRSEVEIIIEDTGPGIPEEHLGKIFDPFFTTSDGTGLGLSISYGIIRAHGGSIVAQNREEGGARFTLRFPGAQPAVVSRRIERNET